MASVFARLEHATVQFRTEDLSCTDRDMIKDNHEDQFFTFYDPSVADRDVARKSRANFSGGLLVGPWPGRFLQTGSWLELCWNYCLDARRMTARLMEQQVFQLRLANGETTPRYLDSVVEQTDGRRIAYTIKPEAKVTGAFLEDMGQVKRQAKAVGFVDDLRLLTDTDLDPVELHNAQLTHAHRQPQSGVDRAARAVVGKMSGLIAVSDLVARMNVGSAGFGALCRLVRAGILTSVNHEKLTLQTQLFKSGEAK